VNIIYRICFRIGVVLSAIAGLLVVGVVASGNKPDAFGIFMLASLPTAFFIAAWIVKPASSPPTQGAPRRGDPSQFRRAQVLGPDGQPSPELERKCRALLTENGIPLSSPDYLTEFEVDAARALAALELAGNNLKNEDGSGAALAAFSEAAKSTDAAFSRIKAQP
jgi:hypothetical protein